MRVFENMRRMEKKVMHSGIEDESTDSWPAAST